MVEPGVVDGLVEREKRTGNRPILLVMSEADSAHWKWARRWAALRRMYPVERPCFADRDGDWCLRDFIEYAGEACGFKHPLRAPQEGQSDGG